MIEVRNITKSYGDKKVVDNVSLNIEEGKITSFIGPNGAGKSTLLSIISRLIKRDCGEVIIDGKEVLEWDNKELAKKVSILRQTNNINIRLTIRELVEFGRFPHCGGNLKKEDIENVEQALRYMKLEDIQDKYLDELSGGQRQRAYIAMVIAQNSDYIFLDEPLNNLDMKHSVEIMKILRTLTDELGKTVVIVIHDINFASCYSDNIVALKDGKLVKNGPATDTIQKEELEKIYEIDFHIENINNRNICVYF
ncbi:ATP-binding cassette domain-containing protein [Clostridium sp. NSJ-6]|uniref:ATP-binding cassette domain-containing protein n=1 Tax=Clostridium hominis TaxID=2763036 RepID=A0ABR7DFI1_9CLOT|nr:ATP-binding cassette domain-containing protein [Clostridium hominis]MBC5629598.1 ATP-binding cassette domain-containing protein [Clostridium hominis]MDU2673459.1 ATP-binding cassette domain-containing protein [Clostridium sp.]